MATKSNPAFKVVRSVTQTVLKLEKGQPRYLYALAPMYLGEKLDKDKEAATLLPVCDMETGEVGIVIAPTILQLELVRSYGGTDYVGKAFELVISRDPNVKYNHVSIAEVAPLDDFKPPPAPKPAAEAMKAAADKIAAKLAEKAAEAGAAPKGKR